MEAQGCRFRLLGEGPFGMTRIALGTALACSMYMGKIWDIAAPTLLVEEAGGKVTDLEGNAWKLQDCPVVATNGRLHDTVLSLLTEQK